MGSIPPGDRGHWAQPTSSHTHLMWRQSPPSSRRRLCPALTHNLQAVLARSHRSSAERTGRTYGSAHPLAPLLGFTELAGAVGVVAQLGTSLNVRPTVVLPPSHRAPSPRVPAGGGQWDRSSPLHRRAESGSSARGRRCTRPRSFPRGADRLDVHSARAARTTILGRG